VVVNAEGGVRFPDADQSNYVGFQAPATVLANLTWTLPDADGTSGQAITTDGSGALGWSTFLPIGGGALTGDLTLNAQSDLRFADSDSSNWVAFQGPATVASNVTWTLPAADGTSGQVLSTDGSGALSWATAAAGGASVTTSDTAPSSPSDGDLWYDSVGGRLYVYYDDGNTSQWVDAAPQGGGGGGASVTASATAPTSPTDGALWYDTNSGRLFIYFDDGDTSQWADAAPQSGVSAVELWTQTGGTLTPTTSTDLVAANGFKFPATQVASADANTLDDYEEGTFTPTFTATTGSVTSYNSQVGRYRKIGSLVVCNIYLDVSNKGTLSGPLKVASLPFVGASGSGVFMQTVVTYYSNMAINIIGMTGYSSSGSFINLRRTTAASTTNATTLESSEVNTAFDIMLMVTYIV